MWKIINSIETYISENILYQHSYKLAIFDLDGTLITRKNGKIPHYFDPDPSNWIFLGNVIETLLYYQEHNYTIIILTNQSRYTDEVKDRLSQIIKKLEHYGISLIMLVPAGKDNISRKPQIGSFDVILKVLNTNIQNIKKIFVCGDAVGETDDNPSYRWSDVDYLYYRNLKNYLPLGFKIKFKRPIEIFSSNAKILADKILEKNIDVVILMGNQGSGKSTFSNFLKEEYVILEQDVLKTIPKMLKNAKVNLINGQKIVIDATNPSIEKREVWINLAKEYNKTYCIVWSIKNGYEFNKYRLNKIPDIAYNIYSKKFEEPTKHEAKVYKMY